MTVIYIRRDAFDELLNHVNPSYADFVNSIQTSNFIFKPEKHVIDVIDKEPVIISRHGKIVYEE